jgi:CubicO group peptidase (beta-lactamase class C family)
MFLEQNVFDALEMTHSDYNCQGDHLASGYTAFGIRSRLIEWPKAYSICTTAEDLFSWDQSLYSEKLVPHELIDLMFTAHIDAPEFGDVDYGYGWFIGKRHNHTVAGHGGWIPGSGFRSIIQHYPDDKLAIIVLSNQADTDVFAIASQIADLVFANSPAPIPRRTNPTSRQPFAAPHTARDDGPHLRCASRGILLRTCGTNAPVIAACETPHPIPMSTTGPTE